MARGDDTAIDGDDTAIDNVSPAKPGTRRGYSVDT
jgi:hypothetical protein